MSAKNKENGAAVSTGEKTTPEKKKVFRYRKVSDFSEQWTGKSPQEINPEFVRSDENKYSDKDLLEVELGIHGFIELDGEYEGKPHKFAVMCCTAIDDEEGERPFTVTSSGMVVLKKLRRIAEKSGFPVACKIMKEKSYFDLVDC